MDRRGGSELMQRSAGEPAAENCIDGRGEADQTFLAGKLRRVARVNSGQGLAETVQRGLGRSRAHGNPRVCSCFVLRFLIPPMMSSALQNREFSPCDEGVNDWKWIIPKAPQIPGTNTGSRHLDHRV